MHRTLGSRLLEGQRKWFWVAAAVATGLDQVSKHFLARPVEGIQHVVDLLPFLRLVRRPLNVQGLFSLGPSSALFYAIATGVGLLLIGYLFFSTRPEYLRSHMALGLLCGGAVGNLIDRLALGGVRDFIDLHLMGRHWPTFNLADTAICVGIGLLVLEAFHPAEEHAQQDSTEEAAASRP